MVVSSSWLVDHSRVDSFPVDSVQFPMAVDVPFIEIVLNAGEFLTIPRQWFHWIVTEPHTVSLSFIIHHMSGPTSHPLLQSFITNQPLHQHPLLNNTTIRPTHEEVSRRLLHETVQMTIGVGEDVSPPIKHVGQERKKCFYRAPFQDSLKLVQENDFTGYLTFTDLNSLSSSSCNEWIDINRFISSASNLQIGHETRLWMSLDKKVNSGLHRDPSGSVLYVLTGRKHVRLSHPMYASRLYITSFPSIPVLTSKEQVLSYLHLVDHDHERITKKETK